MTRLAFVGLILSTALAHGASFQEVRRRVYDKPETTLPTYPGVGALDVLNAVTRTAGPLIDRANGTLTKNEDFKAVEPKLLHPMGVCAEATWTIDQQSTATGLLSAGTKVRGIVRFSTGDNQTTYTFGKKNRIFGLAVKLFPTQDENANVETVNLFTLDQNGLDGSPRQQYMSPDGNGEPVYFTNWAKGTGFAVGLLVSAFDRVESALVGHPVVSSRRPLYPFTEIDSHGRRITPIDAGTPNTLRLVPKSESSFYWDFRDELRAFGTKGLSFDVVLYETYRIGTLKVGQPVASTFCDQELHFHHHPNR